MTPEADYLELGSVWTRDNEEREVLNEVDDHVIWRRTGTIYPYSWPVSKWLAWVADAVRVD